MNVKRYKDHRILLNAFSVDEPEKFDGNALVNDIDHPHLKLGLPLTPKDAIPTLIFQMFLDNYNTLITENRNLSAEFRDTRTKRMMKNPVTWLKNGKVYDKKPLQAWLELKNKPPEERKFVKNASVKSSVHIFQDRFYLSYVRPLTNVTNLLLKSFFYARKGSGAHQTPQGKGKIEVKLDLDYESLINLIFDVVELESELFGEFKMEKTKGYAYLCEVDELFETYFLYDDKFKERISSLVPIRLRIFDYLFHFHRKNIPATLPGRTGKEKVIKEVDLYNYFKRDLMAYFRNEAEERSFLSNLLMKDTSLFMLLVQATKTPISYKDLLFKHLSQASKQNTKFKLLTMIIDLEVLPYITQQQKQDPKKKGKNTKLGFDIYEYIMKHGLLEHITARRYQLKFLRHCLKHDTTNYALFTSFLSIYLNISIPKISTSKKEDKEEKKKKRKKKKEDEDGGDEVEGEDEDDEEEEEEETEGEDISKKSDLILPSAESNYFGFVIKHPEHMYNFMLFQSQRFGKVEDRMTTLEAQNEELKNMLIMSQQQQEDEERRRDEQIQELLDTGKLKRKAEEPTPTIEDFRYLENQIRKLQKQLIRNEDEVKDRLRDMQLDVDDARKNVTKSTSSKDSSKKKKKRKKRESESEEDSESILEEVSSDDGSDFDALSEDSDDMDRKTRKKSRRRSSSDAKTKKKKKSTSSQAANLEAIDRLLGDDGRNISIPFRKKYLQGCVDSKYMIHLSRLPRSVEEVELRNVFRNFGNIIDAEVVGQQGWIQYGAIENALKAIEKYDQREFRRVILDVGIDEDSFIHFVSGIFFKGIGTPQMDKLEEGFGSRRVRCGYDKKKKGVAVFLEEPVFPAEHIGWMIALDGCKMSLGEGRGDKRLDCYPRVDPVLEKDANWVVIKGLKSNTSFHRIKREARNSVGGLILDMALLCQNKHSLDPEAIRCKCMDSDDGFGGSSFSTHHRILFARQKEAKEFIRYIREDRSFLEDGDRTKKRLQCGLTSEFDGVQARRREEERGGGGRRRGSGGGGARRYDHRRGGRRGGGGGGRRYDERRDHGGRKKKKSGGGGTKRDKIEFDPDVDYSQTTSDGFSFYS